jgi:hypothetical protein
MSLTFTAARRSRKAESRPARRDAIILIRNPYEDNSQSQFNKAFKALVETRVSKGEDLNRLRAYRDTIPFLTKRSNQWYLAAALVLWYQLGEPSIDRLTYGGGVAAAERDVKGKGKRRVEADVISSADYAARAEPILEGVLALQEENRSKKAQKEVGSEKVVMQMTPEHTLFRYVCMLASATRGLAA